MAMGTWFISEWNGVHRHTKPLGGLDQSFHMGSAAGESSVVVHIRHFAWFNPPCL